MIYSSDHFRKTLRAELAASPTRKFSTRELCMMTKDRYEQIIETCDPTHLARIDYWLSQPDLESPIVNMNAESTRFGILPTHKDKISHDMANPKDVDDFLQNLCFFDQKPRYRNDALTQRQEIDRWVLDHLSTKSKLGGIVPPLTEILLTLKTIWKRNLAFL